jgi:hypothetical protein
MNRSRVKSAPEQDFHIAAARYLDLALPSHCVWTTFPAGGGGRTRGKILKAMGLKPGWPDIQILVRETAYDSIRPMSRFIGLECKRLKGGFVSKSQSDAHCAIRNAGGEVYVVRTLEDIYDALANKEYLKLKAKPLMANESLSPQKTGSINKDRKNG